MTRVPAWDAEEFETLLEHADLNNETMAELLPRRSVGAVEVVRQGVHAYHRGGNTSMLSQVMLQRLERGSVTCPVCRVRFRAAD